MRDHLQDLDSDITTSRRPNVTPLLPQSGMATFRYMSKKTGPRGGTTTISKSGALVRKTIWLHPDEAEALRQAAFDERRSEAAIVRELLRRHFKLED